MDLDFRILILFAINVYGDVLFLYIILTFLQSMAGVVIPTGLRPATSFVYDVSEPFLRVFRGLLPSVRMGGMGLDLSPILAFLTLRFIIAPLANAILL